MRLDFPGRRRYTGSMLTPLDWVIIAVYLGLSLAAGLYFTRRASRSTEEFFLSGRHLPWWLAGTSMVATTFASDTPLYVTGLVRGHGIYENWQWWCFLLSGMAAVFFFARMWHRLGVVTDVELTERRYSGRPAAVLRGFKALYFSVAIHTLIKAQVIVAMAKILDVALGWGKWQAIAVTSGVTILYSLASGYWGVVVTDFLQFAVAMVGAVVLAWTAVSAVGGLSALGPRLAEQYGPSHAYLHFLPPLDSAEVWSLPLLTFLGYMGLAWWARYSSDGGGVVVQRMASCRDGRHALWATLYFNVANYALRPWPWILAALASLILYPAAADHEAVYPRMMMDLLPGGWRGLMLASFFAAFMSTLSTYLNLSSAYFVNDFYRRFLAPQADERHLLRVTRWSMVGLSVLTGVVAYHVTSIIGIFKFLIAFGSGTGLVYILRWYWWRVNAWSEIAAMGASTAVTLYLYLYMPQLPFFAKLAWIVGVSTAVWMAVTLLTHPEPLEHLRAFYEKALPGGPGWRPVVSRLAHPPEPAPLSRDLARWAWGVALVYGLTLGTGKCLLGAWGPGLLGLGVAGVSFWRLSRAWV